MTPQKEQETMYEKQKQTESYRFNEDEWLEEWEKINEKHRC